MIDLTRFLTKQYEFDKYNCGHFVRDIWKELTGEDIWFICQSFVDGDGKSYTVHIRERIKLRKAESPCVCIMQANNIVPHAGVFVDGKILHLSEEGARMDDLAMLSAYYRISYFK